MEKEANQIIYERHVECEKEIRLPSCYTNPESVDAWRHNRMLNSFLPLIEYFPQSTWVTIGDGRYGAEAYFLKNKGLNALATSITDETISIAKKNGYIDSFRSVNAEMMPFPDNSFDFVLCKESYHHFPRPPIAFYEMLRIARIGIILIEPTDDRSGLMNIMKKPLKKLLRKEKHFDFEPVGNYIFRVHSKEIMKMLTAINKPLFAIKNYNDFYLKKLENHQCKPPSLGFRLTKFAIFIQNILCFSRLLNYGKSTILAFKNPIPDELIQSLKRKGYKLTQLPRNPYIALN